MMGAAIVALAACRAGSPAGVATSDGAPPDGALPTPPCTPGAPTQPSAHIGPDVNLRVLCGGRARAAIASVDEHGAGITGWHVSLSGDPAFTLEGASELSSCALHLSVATVVLVPPDSAPAGSTFDAVATVAANDGASFPPGTVKLHGEMTQPVVTVDHTSIDFGDTDQQLLEQHRIVFQIDSPGAMVAAPPEHAPFIFYESGARDLAAGTFPWLVADVVAPPGDYTYPSRWSVSAKGSGDTPPACAWAVTIPIHVHITGPDGGADAASEAP
jgi:hypothetical protein